LGIYFTQYDIIQRLVSYKIWFIFLFFILEYIVYQANFLFLLFVNQIRKYTHIDKPIQAC